MVSANSEGKIGLENHRNQRIIESPESEGTPEGHLVPPPRSEQGHPQLRQEPRAPSSPTPGVYRDGAPTKIE